MIIICQVISKTCLHFLYSEHDLANEGDIYDTVDEDEGDKIYDDLVNIRRELTSQRAQQRQSQEVINDPCEHTRDEWFYL